MGSNVSYFQKQNVAINLDYNLKILTIKKNIIYFNSIGMYVCIEVALRGDAQGIGRSNWAKGKGSG